MDEIDLPLGVFFPLVAGLASVLIFASYRGTGHGCGVAPLLGIHAHGKDHNINCPNRIKISVEIHISPAQTPEKQSFNQYGVHNTTITLLRYKLHVAPPPAPSTFSTTRLVNCKTDQPCFGLARLRES